MTPTPPCVPSSRATPPRGIEVVGAGLEEAFLELTGDPDDVARGQPTAWWCGWWVCAVIPTTYTGFELLRTFRNKRFMIISLAFPAHPLLPDRGAQPRPASRRDPVRRLLHGGHGGVGRYVGDAVVRQRASRPSAPSGGRRQAAHDAPPTRSYFRAKLLTAYLRRVAQHRAAYAAGLSLGVHLAAGDWLEMTGLLLVGLVPFGVLGVLLGHLLTPDSIGPAIGGGTSLLALLGGAVRDPTRPAASCTTSCACSPPTGWCRRARSRSAAGRGAQRGGSSWPPGP